jgi:hypothetical protein
VHRRSYVSAGGEISSCYQRATHYRRAAIGSSAGSTALPDPINKPDGGDLQHISRLARRALSRQPDGWGKRRKRRHFCFHARVSHKPCSTTPVPSGCADNRRLSRHPDWFVKSVESVTLEVVRREEEPWKRCRPGGQNRSGEPRSLRRRRQHVSGSTWRMTTALALKSTGCRYGICSSRCITTFGGDVGT